MATVLEIMTPYDRMVRLKSNATMREAIDKLRVVHSVFIEPSMGRSNWRELKYHQAEEFRISGKDPNKIKAWEIAEPVEYVAEADWDCAQVREHMRFSQQAHLLVRDSNNRIVGIVSISNIEERCSD